MADAAASSSIRALHLYDCADVGRTIVGAARSSGHPWRHLPLRETRTGRSGVVGGGLDKVRAANWLMRRRAEFALAEVVHVHYGARVGVMRTRPRRPYAVHLHGTDIRVQYPDPRFHDEMQRGLDRAGAVIFATPDLAPLAERARHDAVYVPNPVDVAGLPPWRPDARPTVVFASRWSASKGGQAQLDLARSLVRAAPGARFQGLDWGERAQDAREFGVQLQPRMPRDQYLAWLASASAVIGQSTGLLGMSELQAVALGVPVVMPLDASVDQGDPPVMSGNEADLVDATRETLAHPQRTSERLAGRDWALRERSPDRAVEQLAGIYRNFR
ncbi:hypothetical protein [Cellulosimicrobium sp. NPDC057127]|uniref:hypothetical protein n=1 Tax=Cellulosimicrobium sp. NPDC057127 TaxID=3346026 RepID=UPI00362EC537